MSAPDPLAPARIHGSFELPRYWPVVPMVLIVLLLGVRACLHDAPLDRLADAASEPRDPPGTVAHAGSIYIARGGPAIVGFQSDGEARLVVDGHELRGRGLVKERILVMHGPVAIRFAAPSHARLVWSPVGRRGDPEYVPASSLSPEPPDRATFDHPGASPLDGVIALCLLLVVVATVCVIARRRLAQVSRDTWLALAGVFLVALVARLVGLGDQGATWDEDANWAAGRNYVTNVLSLDAADSSWIWNYEHPPVMKLLDGIGAQFADGYGPARALSAIWSALACALLVPIGSRLFQRRAGILAGLIAALLPSLVAHGQVVGHESPTQLWWALGILLSLTAHDGLEPTDRRGLLLRLAGVGTVVGIAMASRYANGFLGPLCALIVVLQAPRATWLRTVGYGAAVMPACAVAAFYAIWPRLWFHPIDHMRAAFAKLEQSLGWEMYMGELTRHPGGEYFVLFLAATTPIVILAGVALWLARGGRDAWSRSWERMRPHAILVAWLVIPLIGVLFSPVRRDGVRYVQPCVLVICVLAAGGFDGLATWLRVKRAFTAIAAAVVLYLAIVLARTAPYYLDYFNEATGGAETVASEQWFEVAWWGEGLDRAVDYVNANAAPNAKVNRDCVEPIHLAWFREDLWANMTTSPATADWIVYYSPRQRRCRLPADARQVYEVRHDGTVLAVVYRRAW